MTAITSPARAPDRRVLVNGKPIQARSVQQTVHQLLYGVLFGFVAAGLYFGIFEVNWYVHLGPVYFHMWYLKPWWDHTLGTWLSQHVWFITQANYPNFRHSVARNLLEPATAGIAMLSLAAPAKYWKARLGLVRATLTPALFVAAYLVLACGGTWLIYWSQTRWNPSGFSHGLWTVVQFGVLGLIISQVLHRIIGPLGARVQGAWVERMVDGFLQRGRSGVPSWVRLPLLAPTIRERGQQQINDDHASGEADQLAAAWRSASTARKVWRKALYWPAGFTLLVLVGVAFVGFIGHIWVGVLGHSFPYLAP